MIVQAILTLSSLMLVLLYTCRIAPGMVLCVGVLVVLVILRNIAWFVTFWGLSLLNLCSGACSTVCNLFGQPHGLPITSYNCLCWPLSVFSVPLFSLFYFNACFWWCGVGAVMFNSTGRSRGVWGDLRFQREILFASMAPILTHIIFRDIVCMAKADLFEMFASGAIAMPWWAPEGRDCAIEVVMVPQTDPVFRPVSILVLYDIWKSVLREGAWASCCHAYLNDAQLLEATELVKFPQTLEPFSFFTNCNYWRCKFELVYCKRVAGRNVFVDWSNVEVYGMLRAVPFTHPAPLAWGAKCKGDVLLTVPSPLVFSYNPIWRFVSNQGRVFFGA